MMWPPKVSRSTIVALGHSSDGNRRALLGHAQLTADEMDHARECSPGCCQRCASSPAEANPRNLRWILFRCISDPVFPSSAAEVEGIQPSREARARDGP